jgi:hypothetical protein
MYSTRIGARAAMSRTKLALAGATMIAALVVPGVAFGTTTGLPAGSVTARFIVPASWAYARQTSPGVCPPSTSATDDITGPLNAALANAATVPNGATVEFGQDACYRLDNEGVLANRTGIVLEGNESVFQRFTPSTWAGDGGWQFSGDTNIAVRDMTFVGLNSGPNAGANELISYPEWGFGFFQDNGVAVANLASFATYGDGLEVGGEHASATLVTNFSAQDITVSGAGRHGVTVATVNGARFVGVHILSAHHGGFDLEVNASDGYIRNVQIAYSSINATGVAFFDGGYSTSSNIYFHDNLIVGSNPSTAWGMCVAQLGGDTCRIDNNTVIQPRQGYFGIEFTNLKTAEAIGNVSPGSGPYGVQISNVTTSSTVEANDLIGYPLADAADSVSGPVTACDNRLVSGGGFTQPTIC